MIASLTQRQFGVVLICLVVAWMVGPLARALRTIRESVAILDDPETMEAIEEGVADIDAGRTFWLHELPFLKVHSMDIINPLLRQPNRDQWRFAESGSIANFGSFPIYVDKNLPKDLAVFCKPDGSITFIKITQPTEGQPQ